MDETTFQIFERVVSTLFNDGVVNFGRILTPFVFTRGLCRKYPNDAQRLWCVYQTAIDALTVPNEECAIFL